MQRKIQVQKCNPYPMGATVRSDGIQFSIECNPVHTCGLILYPKNGEKEIRIELNQEYRNGTIYSAFFPGLQPEGLHYNYYVDDKILVDPYARKISGNEQFGALPEEIRAEILEDFFDWEEDNLPRIPFEESLFYLLHPRGFTKHTSSNVAGKGTYEGIIEKADYIKELGITGLILMPSYEFLETKKKDSTEHIFYHKGEATLQKGEQAQKHQEKLVNYWGYQMGYYFSPKASYASNPSLAASEFKNMVKRFHQEKIELIMQFFFTPEISPGYLLEVLRFWKLEYHVDGFVLLGERIPQELIIQDALLKDTKLIFQTLPNSFPKRSSHNKRNLAVVRDDFMTVARRLLKGDEDMVASFLDLSRKNPADVAVLNYITSYNGFTLCDLVSYDQKHNDDNGENNRDGNSYNYSWNCGVEGPTRKKTVRELRIKQMKNALVFVLFAQGVPMILAGDEFANSQKGNNNPYCQDNAITWLDWGDVSRNQEIFEFTKRIILLRKQHAILHKQDEFRIMDTLSCGFPDISYHGEEVWRPDTENHSRNIGIMFCGKYAMQNRKEDNFFYVAINMHWIPHQFALPRLPDYLEWIEIENTNEKSGLKRAVELPVKWEDAISVSPRSIQIFMSQIKNKE